jgi:putative transposase
MDAAMVVVHPADVQDRDGARHLLGPLASKFLSLRQLWADGAYAGELVPWVTQLRGRLRPLRMQIVRRPEGVRGFEVLPRRWVVERTFGWWGRFRRLSKDYEFHTATSEAMIHLVMIAIMLRRLV